MGLDLWYNSGVKRGTYKSESGYGILSPPRSAQEKNLLTNHIECGTINVERKPKAR